jgi:hypothetical protein
MEKLDREAFCYEEPPKDRYMDKSMNSENMARCETCHYYDSKSCGLFEMLNEKLPDCFDIQENVKPTAYCRGFVSMEKNSTDGLRRKRSILSRMEKEEDDETEKED